MGTDSQPKGDGGRLKPIHRFLLLTCMIFAPRFMSRPIINVYLTILTFFMTVAVLYSLVLLTRQILSGQGGRGVFLFMLLVGLPVSGLCWLVVILEYIY